MTKWGSQLWTSEAWCCTHYNYLLDKSTIFQLAAISVELQLLDHYQKEDINDRWDDFLLSYKHAWINNSYYKAIFSYIYTNLNVTNKYIDCNRTVVSKWSYISAWWPYLFKCTSHATDTGKVTTGCCNSIKSFKVKCIHDWIIMIINKWLLHAY